MKKRKKYDSRETGLEIGLLFAKYFLKIEHLHYGFWTDELSIELHNLPKAQDNFSHFIISHKQLFLEHRLIYQVRNRIGCPPVRRKYADFDRCSTTFEMRVVTSEPDLGFFSDVLQRFKHFSIKCPLHRDDLRCIPEKKAVTPFRASDHICRNRMSLPEHIDRELVPVGYTVD